MGLFSAHRRGFRLAKLRSPIRRHSEFSAGGAARAVLRKIGRLLVAATNDARVVAVVLLLAAAALAVEMADSFR